MATSTKQTYMDLNTQKALKKKYYRHPTLGNILLFLKHLHIYTHQNL